MGKVNRFDTDMIVGKKESVVDEILLLNPIQTPLISAIGFAEPAIQTTHEWIEDSMFAYDSTAVGAVDATATEIEVPDVGLFREEQIIQAGDEPIWDR